MTLVLDASVVAEVLVASSAGAVAAEHMAEHAGELHLPHLAVIETTSVLRIWVRTGDLSEQRAEAALVDLGDLPARRWPVEPLLPRVWQLRHNVTAYDATYVALAEALDADLLTSDRRLARGMERLTASRVVTITT